MRFMEQNALLKSAMEDPPGPNAAFLNNNVPLSSEAGANCDHSAYSQDTHRAGNVSANVGEGSNFMGMTGYHNGFGRQENSAMGGNNQGFGAHPPADYRDFLMNMNTRAGGPLGNSNGERYGASQPDDFQRMLFARMAQNAGMMNGKPAQHQAEMVEFDPCLTILILLSGQLSGAHMGSASMGMDSHPGLNQGASNPFIGNNGSMASQNHSLDNFQSFSGAAERAMMQNALSMQTGSFNRQAPSNPNQGMNMLRAGSGFASADGSQSAYNAPSREQQMFMESGGMYSGGNRFNQQVDPFQSRFGITPPANFGQHGVGGGIGAPGGDFQSFCQATSNTPLGGGFNDMSQLLGMSGSGTLHSPPRGARDNNES